MIHKILIIDDDPDISSLMQYLLTQKGYLVEVAQSGQEGLHMANTFPEPDLIILDYQMEPMDGKAFLIEFESKFPNRFNRVVIILMTGMDPKKVTGCNVDEIISKLGNLSSMQNLIKKHLSTK